MADRIFAGVLKGLERIYKFPSAQRGAPSDLELDLPIQCVHDMDSLATMGAGVGRQNGFWVGGGQHAHVGVGTLITTPDPFNATVAANEFPDPIDARDWSIWIYDVWANADDNADFNYMILSMVQASRARGPWGSGTGSILRRNILDGSVVSDEAVIGNTVNYNAVPMPFRIMRNEGGGVGDSFLRFVSAAKVAGTCNIAINYNFWLGPKGLAPPLFGK